MLNQKVKRELAELTDQFVYYRLWRKGVCLSI